LRFWLDTEFLEDGRTIEIVSVGIVAEDGRELYLCNAECELDKASKWVITNVLPKLPPRLALPDSPDSTPQDLTSSAAAWVSKRQLRKQLDKFIGKGRPGKPEFWAYIPHYDWVAICQLFGPMLNRPAHWPKQCFDVYQLWVSRGSPLIPRMDPSIKHNALADARWCKLVWETLQEPKPEPANVDQ
jgi:hypothetical protein